MVSAAGLCRRLAELLQVTRQAWLRRCSSAWRSFILSFRVSRGRDLRRPVVDSVADGTLAA